MTIQAPRGGPIAQIVDEDNVFAPGLGAINFLGTGVTATANPTTGRVDVTIPGNMDSGASSVDGGPYTCTAAEQVGHAVYVTGAGEVRRADATDRATMPALGFIVSKSSDTQCMVRLRGPLAAFAGLSPGVIYTIAKGSPGSITGTVISAPGVDQKVGTAMSATTLDVNPSLVLVNL